MILVDPRKGSGSADSRHDVELMQYLKGRGVPVELSRSELPAGDMCFEGNGPDGVFMVGVERKRLSDMMTSIRDERLSGHQIIELQNMYKRYYLIIEGIYRENPTDGILEVPRNGKWVPMTLGSQTFMASRLERFVNTLEEFTGIRPRWSNGPMATASIVLNLWHTWNDKEYHEHHAHQGSTLATHVEILKPWSYCRRVARELTGVGNQMSAAIEQYFQGSAPLMMNAPMEWWPDIQVPNGNTTKRLGDALAKKIYKEIHGS